jgi:hypothetical protein
MIEGLALGLILSTLLERHGTAVAVLALGAVFASGFFDAAVLKRKDWACATWFVGLMSLSAWIAYSWTSASILGGVVVFASGLILLIVYYRKSKTEQELSKTNAKT